MPSRPTVRRAEAAARLAIERPQAALVPSGHRGGWDPASGRSEAELLADVIAAAGVDRARLHLEDESRDTIGNAVLVAAHYLRGLTPRPLTVVTSPFHMERSLLIFRAVLGPSWPITGVESLVADGDDECALHEPGFLAETREFLTGIEPGDLRAFAARMRERWPYYRTIARLDPDHLPFASGSTPHQR